MIEMIDFSGVKVGDYLLRVMKGLGGENWVCNARVIEVTEERIICDVSCDVPRRMEFDRQTGIHVFGSDYGWLEFKPAES